MHKVVDIVTLDEFSDHLINSDEVIVKFWATWCVPCARFAPHFSKAAEQMDSKFLAVDIDKSPWAVQELGVQSVPTVKLYRQGVFIADIAKTPATRTVIKFMDEIANS